MNALSLLGSSPDAPSGDLCSPWEASKKSGVGSSTIHKWVEKGYVASYPSPQKLARYPGAILVSVAAVETERDYRASVVTARKTANILGVAPTTVLYYCIKGYLPHTRRHKLYEISLDDVGDFVRRYTAGEVCAPRRLEQAPEVRCALETCTRVFTPDAGSWRRGYGLFCCQDHYVDHIRVRAQEGDLSGGIVRYQAALEDFEQFCQREGLLTREAAAAYMGLSNQTVQWLERRGLLAALYVMCGADEPTQRNGWRFAAYELRNVKRTMRARWENASPAAVRHRDALWLHDWCLSIGMTTEETRAYISRMEERNEKASKLRTGCTSAEELHQRWLNDWQYLQSEYPDEDPNRLLGDVALRDWQQHPEDWPRARYPAKKHHPEDLADGRVRHAARDRVSRALVRLAP